MTPKVNRRNQTSIRIPHDLVEQAEGLSKEWEASAQRKDLVDTIKDLIILENSIIIDNALCLGLGSMELSELRPLPSWEGVLRIGDDEEVVEGQEVKKLQPVGKGRERNNSLYQLLIFETALMSLRVCL